MSLLEAAGLHKAFGEVKAVGGISFNVAPGEIFGLIGPDGAGKSTTLRLIVGLLDADGGRIMVDGLDVARQPEEVRDRLGYMPQQYSLYPDLTVAENLRFYADMYFVPKKERAARLERLYAFSRLKPYADRPAGKLSGGMYKKLALSCNMIHTPKLLLLDEPTNGVDPLSRRELWQILYAFAAEGVAIVVSTPYMDEAERCHRVALIHQGKLLDVDAPAAILGRYTDRLLELVADEPRAAREALAGVPGLNRIYPAGEALKIAARKDVAAAEVVRQALAARGLSARSLRETRPNFEDVFLSRVEDRP
ncbi:MAG: ABC transporter ATP-binding protein [Myxococcales bacterium]|nr:ABC transporter ATP-binding protein [Myxococcales bacterium]